MESGITTKTVEVFQDVKLTLTIEEAALLFSAIAITNASEMTKAQDSILGKFYQTLSAVLEAYENDFDDNEELKQGTE